MSSDEQRIEEIRKRLGRSTPAARDGEVRVWIHADRANWEDRDDIEWLLDQLTSARQRAGSGGAMSDEQRIEEIQNQFERNRRLTLERERLEAQLEPLFRPYEWNGRISFADVPVKLQQQYAELCSQIETLDERRESWSDADVKCLLDELTAARRRAEDAERELNARNEDNPSAQALDDLWRDVILARNPKYGDWEYPGQAYRHLLAEFHDISKERDALAAKLADVERACDVWVNAWKKDQSELVALRAEVEVLRQRAEDAEREWDERE